MRLPIKTISVILLAASAPALAAPVCGFWQYETSTTEFRTCVDDNGKQYCERRTNKDDATIKTVSCS